MSEILAQLSAHPVSTRLSLNGTIIVARDIAHAKLKELIDNGEGAAAVRQRSPDLLRGPGEDADRLCLRLPPVRPPQAAWIPTSICCSRTARGMVMLAKGNRSQQVTDACHKHGGFYLGSIGGPAAVLAQQSIKSLECVAYPELGMEAIWKIEVEDFPAFILVDDKGNDFFQQIQNKQCAGCQQHG
ncbi:fumarate hydratase C-terminal domain-containing protein [Klebsiella variicola subsp. variicola]|nr:fumarate hydratase C-terminal domain-containing protein [Klebsiella variicola subsp. variicola]